MPGKGGAWPGPGDCPPLAPGPAVSFAFRPFRARLSEKAGQGPRFWDFGRLLRGGDGRFFFLHCYGAFSDAFAKVGKLGPAHRAFALHFDLIEARRMHREHALDALAIADAT